MDKIGKFQQTTTTLNGVPSLPTKERDVEIITNQFLQAAKELKEFKPPILDKWEKIHHLEIYPPELEKILSQIDPIENYRPNRGYPVPRSSERIAPKRHLPEIKVWPAKRVKTNGYGK